MAGVVNMDWMDDLTVEVVLPAASAPLFVHTFCVKSRIGGHENGYPLSYDPYADLSAPGARGKLLARMRRNRDQTKHTKARAFFDAWHAEVEAATPKTATATPIASAVAEPMATEADSWAIHAGLEQGVKAPSPLEKAVSRLRDAAEDKTDQSPQFFTTLCGILKPYVLPHLVLGGVWTDVVKKFRDTHATRVIADCLAQPPLWLTRLHERETDEFRIRMRKLEKESPAEYEKQLAWGLTQKAMACPDASKPAVEDVVRKLQGEPELMLNFLSHNRERLLAELMDFNNEMSEDETYSPEAAGEGEDEEEEFVAPVEEFAKTTAAVAEPIVCATTAPVIAAPKANTPTEALASPIAATQTNV